MLPPPTCVTGAIIINITTITPTYLLYLPTHLLYLLTYTYLSTTNIPSFQLEPTSTYRYLGSLSCSASRSFLLVLRAAQPSTSCSTQIPPTAREDQSYSHSPHHTYRKPCYKKTIYSRPKFHPKLKFTLFLFLIHPGPSSNPRVNGQPEIDHCIPTKRSRNNLTNVPGKLCDFLPAPYILHPQPIVRPSILDYALLFTQRPSQSSYIV